MDLERIIIVMGGICVKFKNRVTELNERFSLEIIRKMRTKKCPMFWVLGGPCSGKTTLCSRLARRYHFHHINVDKLLREELSTNDQEEELISDNGTELRLLPREFVIGLIQQEIIDHCFNSRGFLIEGYPRTLSQSEELVREVGPPSLIFYFHSSIHTMKKRLRHERPFLTNIGLGEDSAYIKIYAFQKFFYPLLVTYKNNVIRVDTDNNVDKISGQLFIILDNFLKEQKIRLPQGTAVG